MTNITTEMLEKRIKMIQEGIEKKLFPLQNRKIYSSFARKNISYIEKLLQVCLSYLEVRSNYQTILSKENYKEMQQIYQNQRSLILVELQEIVRYLTCQEKRIDKILKIVQTLAKYDDEKISKLVTIWWDYTPAYSCNAPFYAKEFEEYKAYCKQKKLAKESALFSYSMQRELDYETYYHLASMELEERRVHQDRSFPTQINEQQEMQLITSFTEQKYLEEMSMTQLKNAYMAMQTAFQNELKYQITLGRKNKDVMNEYLDTEELIHKEYMRKKRLLLNGGEKK